MASLMAGALAGGVEAFVTFPLESLKTQLQFGTLNGGKVSLRARARAPFDMMVIPLDEMPQDSPTRTPPAAAELSCDHSS